MAATKQAAEQPKETTTEAAKAPAAKAEKAKDPSTMTLTQKFVELRRCLPQIVKKQHSDGVKYKFAKIFDVYELLAPAMNEWGVDWEIVNEEATRHYDNGDPMYFSSFTMLTQCGKERVVWVYEADLTIRWQNAHDDADTQEVTLHAIGTNDGGPDKAKGSAWTYCLKYYLFEKFNIDQGEDDPDMSDHSSEAPQSAQNGSQQRGQANTRPQGQPPQQGQQRAQQKPPQQVGHLSDAQLSRMYRKGEDAGCSKEIVDRRIHEKYQKQPSELTRAEYDDICNALDAATAKAAAKKEGQDNAQ